MHIFCDSSRHNGCFIFEGEEPRVVPYPEKVTTNVGEYNSVILALEEVKRRKLKNGTLSLEQVTIHTDSLLVVNQVKGEWKCRHTHLLAFIDEVRRLLESLPEVKLEWLEREDNLAGIWLEKKKL